MMHGIYLTSLTLEISSRVQPIGKNRECLFSIRKIQKEGHTGLVSNIKKRFDCVVQVEQFDYDPESDVIRITGRNATENKYLKMGQYQSLEI